MHRSQFEELYQERYGDLVKLAARSVGRQRAEDVVQSAFTELLEGTAGDEDPLTFLVRRARSKGSSDAKLDRRRAAILLRENRVPPVSTRAGDEDSRSTEPREYESGGLYGFPNNALGESTWT